MTDTWFGDGGEPIEVERPEPPIPSIPSEFFDQDDSESREPATPPASTPRKTMPLDELFAPVMERIEQIAEQMLGRDSITRRIVAHLERVEARLAGLEDELGVERELSFDDAEQPLDTPDIATIVPGPRLEGEDNDTPRLNRAIAESVESTRPLTPAEDRARAQQIAEQARHEAAAEEAAYQTIAQADADEAIAAGEGVTNTSAWPVQELGDRPGFR